MNPRRAPRGAALAFGVALVVLAFAAWRALAAGIDWRLQVVPDDTFYYLQIARNLAATGRSTFDGVSVTNGYHPLWMAILTGLATVVHSKDAFLATAQCLSLALHVGIALLVARLIARLGRPAWGWTAALSWLLSPLAWVIALQATEAMVHALAALLVLHAHLDVDEETRRTGRAGAGTIARYGLALGCLCLARTDGIVIVVLALAWLAISTLRGGAGATPAARSVFGAGALAAALLAPWWIFCWYQVGTVVQDSGAMKMLWAADRHATFAARMGNVADTFAYFTARCLAMMTLWRFSPVTLAAAAVVLAGPPLFVLGVRPSSVEARTLRAVILSALALGIVYGALFVERQIWWLTLPCLAMIVAGFVSIPVLLDTVRAGEGVQRLARMAVFILAVALFVRWHVKERTPYPWQPDVRRSQLAVEAVVPASEKIGCLNAGIPAYFGSGRVVAIDGLVNHDARSFWADRRVDEYLHAAGIHYIADERLAMAKLERFSRDRLRLTEVASYPLRGWPTGRRLLWKVAER